MSAATRAVALASFLFLAACATERPVVVPQPQPPAPLAVPTPQPVPGPVPIPPPPTGATARLQGFTLSAPPAMIDEAWATYALKAFIASCPSVQRRADKSGLTIGADWAAPCAAAPSVAPGEAGNFFRSAFDWVQVGNGQAFATGYYEPEIAASRVAGPGYAVPIYRAPPDLIRCTRPDGGTGRGRIDPATGQCGLYFTRAEIDDGALAGRGLELAWAADPVELFFVEIQGSATLRLPDGGVMRIGYADQNGRDYLAIGKLLRDRGVLPQGGARMQDIVAWTRANPDQGRALMRENLSYIFFRELGGSGPLGSLGVAVTPQGTVAADPNFVPLGAPIFLATDRGETNHLWIAQDVGGAIKGANRFDTFWGAGPAAIATAGGMSASGRALILLPRGAAARALARP